MGIFEIETVKSPRCGADQYSRAGKGKRRFDYHKQKDTS